MDSLLDLDRSELESHLFSQLSEIGRRDDGSDVTEEDVDLERYQIDKQLSSVKKSANSKHAKHNTNTLQRSATKTGRLVGDLASRGRSRKTHEVLN